jgi:hypothetical protein
VSSQTEIVKASVVTGVLVLLLFLLFIAMPTSTIRIWRDGDLYSAGLLIGLALMAGNFWQRYRVKNSKVLLTAVKLSATYPILTLGMVFLLLFTTGATLVGAIYDQINQSNGFFSLFVISIGVIALQPTLGRVVLTKQGIFIGLRFIPWLAIQSFALQRSNNRVHLRLRTNGRLPFLNNVVAELSTTEADAVAALLQQKLGVNF